MQNCLKCNTDIDDLVNFDTLTTKYIKCPVCKNKMVVQYDEEWDSDSGDEYGYFWVEQYEDNNQI